MTDYYVGPGGNDGNDGLSWANRFLTLNGAEDEPVSAGDTVYVAPGVYREALTVDVSGAGGNPITYIGDVTGENTDGVGGVVRLTGSDNDSSPTRSNIIIATSKDYRTFRGFRLDGSTGVTINCISCINWILEDLSIVGIPLMGIYYSGAGLSDLIMRRCIIIGGTFALYITHSTNISNTNCLIENCIFLGVDEGIVVGRIGGVTINNCIFIGCKSVAVDLIAIPAVGQKLFIYNSIFYSNTIAMNSAAAGYITEDYNALYSNGTDRVNVSTGGNSNAFIPQLAIPLLIDGFQMPWAMGSLSEWSQLKAIDGNSPAADDFYGITRPVTDTKKSWGAIQFSDSERETGTVYDASDASIKFTDAGRHQMFMPVANESTIISVRVYREADYAGTNPQLIIKQPGQADDITVDVAAGEQWNELTTTLTPAAIPPYVIIELVSNNTAVAGDYDVFFDLIAVS